MLRRSKNARVYEGRRQHARQWVSGLRGAPGPPESLHEPALNWCFLSLSHKQTHTLAHTDTHMNRHPETYRHGDTYTDIQENTYMQTHTHAYTH